MTDLPKPLVMSDTEILDWYVENHKSIFHCDYPEYWLYAPDRKELCTGNFKEVICQAAAIKQQEGKNDKNP